MRCSAGRLDLCLSPPDCNATVGATCGGETERAPVVAPMLMGGDHGLSMPRPRSTRPSVR